MSFKKGEVSNPLGKPKGTLNKTTRQAREAMASIMDGEELKIKRILDSLDGTEYLDYITPLLQYYAPKLSANDTTVIKGEAVDTTELKKLPAAALKKIMAIMEEHGVEEIEFETVAPKALPVSIPILTNSKKPF